jgi:phosphogluconate dehydratase
VLAPAAKPFSADGGLKLLAGNLGRAVIKTSAVKPEHRVVEAPAIVFHTQEALMAAFQRGELNRDFVAVVRFQGPQANGMPELHKLTPPLGVLQDQGHRVALVTDGRMSGASGKVPAAIHVTPECLAGGPLARVRDGDVIVLDAERGMLEGARRSGRMGRARAGQRRPRGLPPRHGSRAVRRVPRPRPGRRRKGAMSFYADEPEPPGPLRRPVALQDPFVFATGPAGSEDRTVSGPHRTRRGLNRSPRPTSAAAHTRKLMNAHEVMQAAR